MAAYSWPNWHVDTRNDRKLGKGWTEWELVKAAGLPGLHINAVAWGVQLSTVGKEPIRDISSMDKPAVIVKDASSLIAALGIDSVTSYVWVHHVGIPAFPSYPLYRLG